MQKVLFFIQNFKKSDFLKFKSDKITFFCFDAKICHPIKIKCSSFLWHNWNRLNYWILFLDYLKTNKKIFIQKKSYDSNHN